MLPEVLRQTDTIYRNDEVWNRYLKKVEAYLEILDRDFISQICFEHFDRFNDYFPRFDIHHHRIFRETITTKELYELVFYDKGKRIDFWYFQMDDYLAGVSKLQYPLLEYCAKHGTWSFPPVLIEGNFGETLGSYELGKPLHLIEGTHRVSFINRLYELARISAEDRHEILMVKP